MVEAYLSEVIVDSFYKVYRYHGYGFLENVYSNSLAIELGARGLRVQREMRVDVLYEGAHVGTCRIDLLVEGRIMLEVKSTRVLVEADERQVLNYLKATSIELGFLLHFGPSPKFRRLILTNDQKRSHKQ